MAVSFKLDEVLDLAFAVGSEEQNETTRVWLSGELDLAGIPLLEQELERLEELKRDVGVLDLDQLLFIDAVGLHAVLKIGESARNGTSPPALVGACPAVSRVFGLVGLEHHLADRP